MIFSSSVISAIRFNVQNGCIRLRHLELCQTRIAPSMVIDVTAAPGRRLKYVKRVTKLPYTFKWFRLQTCNLYFHQFCYICSKLDPFEFTLGESSVMMIIHDDVFWRMSTIIGTESHLTVPLLQTSKRTNSWLGRTGHGNFADLEWWCLAGASSHWAADGVDRTLKPEHQLMSSNCITMHQ